MPYAKQEGRRCYTKRRRRPHAAKRNGQDRPQRGQEHVSLMSNAEAHFRGHQETIQVVTAGIEGQFILAQLDATRG